MADDVIANTMGVSIPLGKDAITRHHRHRRRRRRHHHHHIIITIIIIIIIIISLGLIAINKEDGSQQI